MSADTAIEQVAYHQRSRQEIEDLKTQWRADGCWDLESTDGFEAHREELLTFSQQVNAEYEAAETKKLQDKAALLGCPENLLLARYVASLEQRLVALEQRNSPGV